MENNWEPYVGQKVVVVNDNGASQLTKGEVRTVSVVEKCNRCGKVYVGVGTPSTDMSIPACSICWGDLNKQRDAMYFSNRFVPTNPYSNSVSKELAEQAIKQPIETDVPVKEIVNN